jgi:hypothetical protein
MTAARRPRWAALLVGSTWGDVGERPDAGQSFTRVFASARTCHCRLPVEPPFEQRLHLRFDRVGALLESVALAVVLERLPGLEDVRGHSSQSS